MESTQLPPNKSARFWIVVSIIYLILLGILLVLRYARIGAWQGVIGTVLIAMLTLSPILFVYAARTLRHRWLSLALFAPVLALIIISAPYFLPRQRDYTDAGPALKVLTLNIHQPASDEALTEITRIINQTEADIVAVQELGPSPQERLGKQLEYFYPYQSLHTDENYPGSGQGVLSKYPILAEEYWKAGGEWNGNQRVEIDFDGESIVIYNVHPHPPIERGLDPQMASHEQTLLDVYERAIAEESAVLIMGDFNMTTQFRAYEVIESRYHDAYREVGEIGFGFTHPHFAGIPLPTFWRVDYVFYDPQHFRGVNARMLDGSVHTDHLPLLVRLQLLD